MGMIKINKNKKALILKVSAFLKSEINKLRKKGYSIDVVRLGEWNTFHIKKSPTCLDSIDVIIKPKSAPNFILLAKVRLFDEKHKSYKYSNFESFKKGFLRNIIQHKK